MPDRYRPNIALVGEAGAGKTTLANLLIRRLNYARVSLADPVKLEVGRLLWPAVASAAEVYALIQQHKPLLRGLLQEFGTVNRTIRHADYWLEKALAVAQCWIDLDRPVVVDDCRFLNEAEGLKRAGFVIVRIVRADVHRGMTGTPELTAEQKQHPSEAEARLIDADKLINNSGDEEYLWRQLYACMGPGALFDVLRYTGGKNATAQ